MIINLLFFIVLKIIKTKLSERTKQNIILSKRVGRGRAPASQLPVEGIPGPSPSPCASPWHSHRSSVGAGGGSCCRGRAPSLSLSLRGHWVCRDIILVLFVFFHFVRALRMGGINQIPENNGPSLEKREHCCFLSRRGERRDTPPPREDDTGGTLVRAYHCSWPGDCDLC